ncbi:polysaccharide deacetylase family protein [Georgenia yuyongxinii]|uniref:Polysaccharide deacetylase family protein n=1 Tax=Georgenia yuyongxinii TaxID=2589797 RepID=A0A5B8C4N4_9MICO|nr:polysaccharide deacetylase family protein [Georgenia yuyongxinii]QDC25729.1 polysaccharide deacetylase family protein [Georgenia yuyongxinii]
MSRRIRPLAAATALSVAGALGLLTGPAAAPAAAATCSSGYVALTFDDGPRAVTTGQVLDALKGRSVRATFFVVGQNVERLPALVRRAVAEGHRVENHSWAHERLTDLSAAGVRTSLSRADQAVRNAGVRGTRLFRPPYGLTNATVRSVAADLGLRQVLWSVDPTDYATGTTSAQIRDRVLGGLAAGAVVLLHDGVVNSPATVGALPGIIDGARARGFCFGVLTDSGAVVPPATPTPTKVTFYLTDTWGPGTKYTFAYGRPTDAAYTGDWDGDGRDSLAVRRDATLYAKNALGAGAADVAVTYGRFDDAVVVGDWDGDGRDTLAVRRGSTYHLRNSLTPGPADAVVTYGRTADTVLVGDWDGDGRDTLAVRRGSTVYVRNSLSDGPADVVVTYGRSTDTVLVGDWNGDGRDTLAVRRASTYYLRNSLTPGDAEVVATYGRSTDQALVGDWDGDRGDTLGVRRLE